MGKIVDVNLVEVSKNRVSYNGKKLGKWWGKTLYKIDPKTDTLRYRDFSIIGLFFHFFGYKNNYNSQNLHLWINSKKEPTNNRPLSQISVSLSRSHPKANDSLKKIILREGGNRPFEVTTDCKALKEVAKNFFRSNPNKDPILTDIFHHLDDSNFQKDPTKYVSHLIKDHKSDPVKNETLSFLCALIRDLATNPEFPWNIKESSFEKAKL